MLAAEEILWHSMPGAAAGMDQWIENGYGNHDWTVTAKDSV